MAGKIKNSKLASDIKQEQKKIKVTKVYYYKGNKLKYKWLREEIKS